jgi:hypothetical protein
MAYGHEGFISIYENDGWLTGEPINPQALWVESESLGLVADVKHMDDLVGASRASQGSSFVLGPVKPAGGLKVPLRVPAAYKLLYSHFQYGSFLGTDVGGNRQYRFYPSKATPNYETGNRGDGAYGGTGYVFGISVLKKYNNKDVAHAQWFNYGVTDKLEFSFASDSEAFIEGKFKFATFYNGTNIGTARVPDGTYTGSYNNEPAMGGWSGSLLVDGVALDMDSLTIVSDNAIEEKNILGMMNPYSFSFGKYSCTGRFTLPMPDNGLQYVGSMLTNKVFSLSGTFTSGTNVLSVSMPYCRYNTFDVLPNRNNSEWKMSIPFTALENNGTSPITVGWVSWYGQDLFYDAWEGARTLAEFELLDAEASTRTLGDFTYYDRDL